MPVKIIAMWGAMFFKRRIEQKPSFDFPSHRQERGFSVLKLVTCTGLVLICCLLVVLSVQHVQYRNLKSELEQYESKIEYHEQVKVEKEEKIERLQDPDYIEVEARRRLGLIRPDEVIFQLED